LALAGSNVRTLDSRFSVIGAFWSPETPDTIMKGALASDEREINFITAPLRYREDTALHQLQQARQRCRSNAGADPCEQDRRPKEGGARTSKRGRYRVTIGWSRKLTRH